MHRGWIVSRFILILFFCISNSEAASADAQLVTINNLIIKHAPYKQYNTKTRQYNANIGRSPAAACESILFLVEYYKLTGNRETHAKILELTNYILAQHDKKLMNVPASPDLEYPISATYYTMDAALCGEAMLSVYNLFNREEYLLTAISFAKFLDKMHAESGYNGLCEYYDRSLDGFNCNTYTKNLIALSFLRKLYDQTGHKGWNILASNIKKFALHGLERGWEFYSVAENKWKRVKGSHGEGDIYVYGDTVAYALKGLFEYEGDSPLVRKIYEHFMTFGGGNLKTKATYNPKLCLAGYLVYNDHKADADSAYYDVVTIGLLHGIKQKAEPADFKNTCNFLLSQDINTMFWYKNYDLKIDPLNPVMDIVTLANIGSAIMMCKRI